MTNVVELGDEDKIKLLLYGNPKQGKTTAAAGAARIGKVVAIDTEGQGWLKKPLQEHLGDAVDNIVKLKATSYEDMEANYWHIQSMFRDDDQTDPFVVVVDHMTDLENRFLRAETLRRTDKLRKPIEAKIKNGDPLGKYAAELKEINQFKTEIQDYGVWTNQASHLMRMYRDLPCHVIFIAHYRTDRGVRVPALTERFRLDLMGSMNMVIAMERLQVGKLDAFVGYTREQDGWYGGDRFNTTRPIVVNPSFDRLVWALEGKLDWSQDEEQKAFKRALQEANN